MKTNAKSGFLLVNLGTPDDPSPDSVGRYLDEFLMDPLVIDIPWIARWFLVKRIIIPRRSGDSAKLYRSIWAERGSPLLFHSQDLTRKVQDLLGPEVSVKLAMRYGKPNLAGALDEFEREGVRSLTVLPLYPQYSLAATESSIQRVKHLAKQRFALHFIPPFYADPAYLDAVAEVSRPVLAERPFDKVIFSYHGLPERQVKKTAAKGHCLASETCCDMIDDRNRNCYRAQCYATSRALAARLGIDETRYIVAFQSRLNQRWIRPFSDDLYRDLPKEGIKRLAVLSPSFVADCLETLEEISIRGREQFRANGGECLRLIPSLNATEPWVRTVAGFYRQQSPVSCG